MNRLKAGVQVEAEEGKPHPHQHTHTDRQGSTGNIEEGKTQETLGNLQGYSLKRNKNNQEERWRMLAGQTKMYQRMYLIVSDRNEK